MFQKFIYVIFFSTSLTLFSAYDDYDDYELQRAIAISEQETTEAELAEAILISEEIENARQAKEMAAKTLLITKKFKTMLLDTGVEFKTEKALQNEICPICQESILDLLKNENESIFITNCNHMLCLPCFYL